MFRNVQHKSGFTLVEVLVALSMFAMISVAVGWFVIQSLRSTDIIWDQLDSQNDGRAILEQFVDDVRRAEPSSVGGYPIESASSSEFIFFANIDNDIGRERVRIFLDGTNIKKGVVQPSGDPLGYAGEETFVTVATYAVNTAVGTPLFEYYDETYPVTSTPLTVPDDLTDIRIVRMQIELEKDPDKTPVPLHVEAVAGIRNLKQN